MNSKNGRRISIDRVENRIGCARFDRMARRRSSGVHHFCGYPSACCLAMIVIALFMIVHPPVAADDVPFSYGYGVVNDSNLRLRKAPNLDADVLQLLQKGVRVHVLDITDEAMQIGAMIDYWYFVDVGDGIRGWSYGYFIDFDRSPDSVSRIVRFFEGRSWTRATLSVDGEFFVRIPAETAPDVVRVEGRRRGLPDVVVRLIGKEERYLSQTVEVEGNSIMFTVHSSRRETAKLIYFRPDRRFVGIDLWDLGEGPDFFVRDRYVGTLPTVQEERD